MSSIAHFVAYLPAKGKVPRPRYPWQRLPDAFQSHADGVLWVLDRGGNRAKVTCSPGQYHGLSIAEVDWSRSDVVDLTLFWF